MDVRSGSVDSKLLKYNWIVGRRKGKCRFWLASFGRALKQQSSRVEISDTYEFRATLDEFRDQIRAKLTGDREDQQMNPWLAEGRRRTPVVYHEEAFR